jgi:DNA-binding transcriptional LysR family regulator
MISCATLSRYWPRSLLLSQFAREFPAVRLDVSVNTYPDLRAMIAGDELDLAVVVSQSESPDETVLRQAKFVWIAAETFEPPEASSLPLLFSPEPCVIAGSALPHWKVFLAIGTSSSRRRVNKASGRRCAPG